MDQLTAYPNQRPKMYTPTTAPPKENSVAQPSRGKVSKRNRGTVIRTKINITKTRATRRLVLTQTQNFNCPTVKPNPPTIT